MTPGPFLPCFPCLQDVEAKLQQLQQQAAAALADPSIAGNPAARAALGSLNNTTKAGLDGLGIGFYKLAVQEMDAQAWPQSGPMPHQVVAARRGQPAAVGAAVAAAGSS